jgi:hypothetical protein
MHFCLYVSHLSTERPLKRSIRSISAEHQSMKVKVDLREGALPLLLQTT